MPPKRKLKSTPSSPPAPPPASTFTTPSLLFRTQFRLSLQTHLSHLLASRQGGRTDLIPEEEMNTLVKELMSSLDEKEEGEESQRTEEGEEGAWKKEFRKSVVDRCLEECLTGLAMRQMQEGAFASADYGLLADLLDSILTFSELEYADPNLPLSCLGQLLDLQTIDGCHHVFAYIESRVDRLTVKMEPQKGKGPLLLRLLNELLRRLPKSKTEHVIFSGRILMFLSSVFPLGEKSGVNLKGNFNTGKQAVFEIEEGKAAGVGEKEREEESKEDGEGDVEMAKEEGAIQEPEEDFYATFWSLQTYFNNPPLLFTSTTSTPTAFTLLHHGLTKTLEAFSEVTKKERTVLGAGAKDGHNKKAVTKAPPLTLGADRAKERMTIDDGDGDATETENDKEIVMDHYFFPKFLTSRTLLDLELADPTFRRQILIQMLVLFQYLLSFTPAARAKALALPTTNLPALPNHSLSPENEKWVNDLRIKTLTEMREMEGGLRFSKTVELILLREQNWINWKLQSCRPFEMPAMSSARSQVARDKFRSIQRKTKPYPYNMGNAVLSKLWEKNTTTLEGFQVPASKENFDVLVREWMMTERIIKQKEKMKTDLEASPESPERNQKVASLANELDQLDIKSKALHWRALRIGSTTYLHLYQKIDAGDLNKLVEAIEKEREAEEERLTAVEAGVVGEGEDMRVEGQGKEVGEEEGAAKEEEEEAKAVELGVEAPDPNTNESGSGPPSRVGSPKVEEEKETETETEKEGEQSEKQRSRGPPTPKRPRTKESDDVEMADGDKEPEAKKVKQAE